jgi:hypothetical protein
VFEQACASCHRWTGVSPLSPVATISGSRAVNDPTATNVAQIVISGTQRFTPASMSMPAFGSTYTDTEIAAVANYVTGRLAAINPRSATMAWRICAGRPCTDRRPSMSKTSPKLGASESLHGRCRLVTGRQCRSQPVAVCIEGALQDFQGNVL